MTGTTCGARGSPPRSRGTRRSTPASRARLLPGTCSSSTTPRRCTSTSTALADPRWSTWGRCSWRLWTLPVSFQRRIFSLKCSPNTRRGARRWRTRSSAGPRSLPSRRRRGRQPTRPTKPRMRTWNCGARERRGPAPSPNAPRLCNTRRCWPARPRWRPRCSAPGAAGRTTPRWRRRSAWRTCRRTSSSRRSGSKSAKPPPSSSSS